MTDPFAEDLPRRDHYGRPLIKQADGSEIAYTRISTLSGMIVDKTGLHEWEKRCVALGLGNDLSLATAAASLGQTYADLSKQDKRDLDDIIAIAHEKAGGNEAARYGTAFHRFTEPARRTVPSPGMKPQVNRFIEKLAEREFEVTSTERFVVNHAYRIAGTYDHTVQRKLGKVLILDKKTGRKDIPSWIVQLYAYAICQVYDPQTGRLSPLDVSRDWGAIAWAPIAGEEVTLMPLPLRLGSAGFNLALGVRDWRQEAAKVRPTP